MTATTPKTRSVPPPSQAIMCGYCLLPFQPKRARQTFCSDKCKGDHFRDVGVQAKVVSNRQTKRGSRFIVQADAFMDAPPGTMFRLVRVP